MLSLIAQVKHKDLYKINLLSIFKYILILSLSKNILICSNIFMANIYEQTQ